MKSSAPAWIHTLLAICTTSLLVVASTSHAQDLSITPEPELADEIAPDPYLPDEGFVDELVEGGGQIEVIRERYPNRRVKLEREVTLDAQGNYVNHGVWKMWSDAGKLVAEGSYNMGQRHGVWTRWHQRNDSPSLREYPFSRFQSPFVSQATFVDGKLDGDWLIFDANQEKCCQITVDHGVRNGEAIIWLPGGQVYRQAVYENNVPVGDVQQLGKDGTLETVATYVDGRRVITKATHFDGSQEKKTEANYLGPKMVLAAADDFWNATFAEYETEGKEVRHGVWKTWYSNGQLKLEGYYRWDAELGTFTWWHPNGQRAVVGQYVDGRQHGEWVWWHANGQKATVGVFEMGIQNGLWRQWTPDGHLESQQAYDATDAPEELAEDAPTESEPLETAEKPSFPELPWMNQ